MTRKTQFSKPTPVISSHSGQVCLGSLQLINALQAHREFRFPPGEPSQGLRGRVPWFHQAPSGFGTSSNDPSYPPLETVTPGRHLSGQEEEYHRRKFLPLVGCRSTIAMGSGKKRPTLTDPQFSHVSNEESSPAFSTSPSSAASFLQHGYHLVRVSPRSGGL